MAKDAKYWVSRFGVFDDEDDSELAEEKLVRMGKRAVPALVARLKDEERGWQAAMVLGQIGLPAAKKAIAPLLKVVTKGTKSTGDLWSARALAQMGQVDLVWALANSKRHLPAVIAGLKEARPQAYAHFAELLDRKDKKLSKAIAEELSPGSAHYDPAPESFELIAEAVASPHVAIRKDALLALVEFRGMKAKKRAVEIVVPLLTDRDAEVRRLALLALERCKSAARPAVPAIRPLLKDKVPNVRLFALRALDAIGG